MRTLLTFLISTALLIGLGAVLLFFVFGRVVYPGEIGVRQNYFSLGVMASGFQRRGLEPGLHWKIPFLSTVHTISRDLKFIHFHDADAEDSALKTASLRVRTTDGAEIVLDVTLMVRLFDDSGEIKIGNKTIRHGGPADLFTSLSGDPKVQLERVAQIAANELRVTLSALKTSEFYLPAKREIAKQLAHERSAEKLAPYGVEVWATLIRNYSYASQEIDDQIFEKVLQDQTGILNAARARLAEEQSLTAGLLGKLDAEIRTAEVEGQGRRKELEAEGNFEQETRKAKGDRLVTEAQAHIEAARAAILKDTPGADAFVARELLPFISTLKGGIVRGINPFDIRSWSERLLSHNDKPREERPKTESSNAGGALK